jgi:hypothetical protein
VGSACWLPVVLWRGVGLERRLGWVRGGVAVVGSLSILVVMGVIAVAYLRGAPAFVGGGHRRGDSGAPAAEIAR